MRTSGRHGRDRRPECGRAGPNDARKYSDKPFASRTPKLPRLDLVPGLLKITLDLSNVSLEHRPRPEVSPQDHVEWCLCGTSTTWLSRDVTSTETHCGHAGRPPIA